MIYDHSNQMSKATNPRPLAVLKVLDVLLTGALPPPSPVHMLSVSQWWEVLRRPQLSTTSPSLRTLIPMTPQLWSNTLSAYDPTKVGDYLGDTTSVFCLMIDMIHPPKLE